MLKSISLSLLLLLIGFYAYSRRPTEQRVEITLASELIRNNQLASFSFCKAVPIAWDSILVLKPYCPPEEVKRFGINNYLNTRLFAPSQAYNDFTCTLLFLKKNSCVGYSVISRQIVDLAELANEKDFNLALITRTKCVKKLHRDESSGIVSMVD